MQFTAIIVLTLLVLKLLLLPRKVAVSGVVAKARWLMTTGILFLDVQFLLQYVLGLRAMGVTQAVLVNLVLFIPVSWAISLALLYLQRQGRVNIVAQAIGGVAWVVVLALLGVAATIDGQPLLSDTPELHSAEVAASVVYLMMQGYYSGLHLKNIVSMRHALQNYYDSDTDGLLRWMKLSILVLMVMSLMVPLLIFVRSAGLAIFGVLFFIGIFFLVDSFCGYAVSSAPKRVSAAEEYADEEVAERQIINDELTTTNGTPELTPEVLQHVAEAASQWTEQGGYRQAGINIPSAAEAIGVPRYLLSAWLKHQGYTYAKWMTALRIEEALRVIKEHPDWSNETVASHCGFSDRSYFQRKFKETTGQTPAEYLERCKEQGARSKRIEDKRSNR